MLSDLNFTDMETGYKAFRAEIVKSIELEESRFDFEPEITAKIAMEEPTLRKKSAGGTAFALSTASSSIILLDEHRNHLVVGSWRAAINLRQVASRGNSVEHH